MDPNTHRAEAERWLGIAAKLLTARDFLGSKTFAIRARESDPNNSVSDQILAVVDTVLSGEKRVNSSQQPDWYSVLQLPKLVRDPELIANHYRRLVLLLNPERNRLPFADYALQLVMEAWAVLSDANKKWIFDNELALYLQQAEQQQQQQHVGVVQTHAAAGAVAGNTAAAVAATSGSSSQQLNTFQFFQPQPLPQQPMWQQQQQQQQHHQLQNEHHHHNHHHQQQNNHHEQQQEVVFQREFMSPPPAPPPPAPPQQQQQQLPPQWQMRDPTPIKGSADRIKRPVAQQAIRATAAAVPVPASTPVSEPTPALVTPSRVPKPTLAVVAPARVVVSAVAAPNAATRVVDGNNNVENVGNGININSNHDSSFNGGVVNGNVDVNESNNGEVGGDENNVDGVVEEVECFWTACPYCFYIYEYQKVYQDCTLKCQNCKRGFHAVQIPNPPPISGGNAGGGDSGSGKDKGNSFCCWGFFPIGFSMAAWKKQNRGGNLNGSSNWVPFSPMFACPGDKGAGNFEWFDSNAAAAVGPKDNEIKRRASTPRVYIDDEDEDFLDFSDPSDSDSSDGDWRSPSQYQKKRKKKKGGKGGPGRKAKVQAVHVENEGNHNPDNGGGVPVGGDNVEEESNTQHVVESNAEAKANASKNVTPTITRKQTRRSVKDRGRLDLNVEFNNDVDEHAPAVSAANREEDGIENIAFFEGLDEFLSTLPILNVGGDEKAKAS